MVIKVAKILFVIDSLGCGGAEKSLVSLLPLLNKEKYEIHLWMIHRGGVFEKLVPGNVIIEKTPASADNNWYKNRLAQLQYSILFRWNSFIKKREQAKICFSLYYVMINKILFFS